MLDRTIAPDFVKTQEIKLKEAETTKIKDVPVHLLKAGTQEVVKIEFIFNAGKKYETHDGAAYFTSSMLREGTKNHSSNEIARLLDKYGAHLELSSTLDISKVGLYCMSKHVEFLLPLLLELISEPIFPEEQLSLQKEIEQQQLLIDLKKSKFRAQRAFRSILFGSHPYGQSLAVESINNVTSDILKEHYRHCYTNYEVFISGNFDEELILRLLNGHIDRQTGIIKDTSPVVTNYKKSSFNEDIEDNPQKSLRLGLPFVPKKHPDYIPFQILNHLLGGYFGSRLMKNIREEKGFTYGIYSSVTVLQQSSYFSIATDVVKESTEVAVSEIIRELNILKTDEIPLDELETVKNHIAGSFQADITSPFALMDKYKSLYLHGMEYDYFDTYFDILDEISPKQLQDLANKYLREEQLSIVTVG